MNVYSSDAAARAAIARLSKQPGFIDHPNGFHVEAFELNQDHWREGFGFG